MVISWTGRGSCAGLGDWWSEPFPALRLPLGCIGERPGSIDFESRGSVGPRSPRAVARRIELIGADGTTITVEVSGAGRPMLLVHGLGGSHHDWDATVECLARSHRVYTLDLGGHGARAAVDARPTLQTMARD